MIYEDLLPDIPRYVTAFSEWLACLVCMIPLIKKWDSKQSILALGFLLGQFALQIFVGTWPLYLWILGMLINIAWMGLTLFLLSQAGKAMTLILTVKAFIISELLASVAWQVYAMIAMNKAVAYLILGIILACHVALFIIVALVWIDRNIDYQTLTKILNRRVIITFAVAGVIIFFMANIGFILTQTTYHLGNSYSVFLIRSVVNIMGVSLLYLILFQLIDAKHRRELDAVQNVFQIQYQQYKAFAENTHYINRRAHDLKHQIQMILAEDDIEIRKQYLADLSEAVDNLGRKIETGNGVLDAILTRKNMYCQDRGINFTCVANGNLLKKMEVMDIASLFGNALDNAFEHVEKIPDQEKRLVTLKLQEISNMVVLRIDNYCQDVLEDLTVLPTTSKKDKDLHGYGLLNIQFIAKKYGGQMTLAYEDHWFSLTVVFPQ